MCYVNGSVMYIDVFSKWKCAVNRCFLSVNGYPWSLGYVSFPRATALQLPCFSHPSCLKVNMSLNVCS